MDDLDPAGEPFFHQPTEIQWPDPEHGPWTALVWWQEVGGRLECVALSIGNGVTLDGRLMTDREPAPITATNLREQGLQRLLAEARTKFLAGRQAALEYHAAAELVTPASVTGLRRSITVGQRKAVKRAAPGRTLGRPVYLPEHWEAVRDTYLRFNREGSRSPTADVAVHFGVATSTAAKWISRCRNEFGLLPKTTQGKAKAKEAT